MGGCERQGRLPFVFSRPAQEVDDSDDDQERIKDEAMKRGKAMTRKLCR